MTVAFIGGNGSTAITGSATAIERMRAGQATYTPSAPVAYESFLAADGVTPVQFDVTVAGQQTGLLWWGFDFESVTFTGGTAESIGVEWSTDEGVTWHALQPVEVDRTTAGASALRWQGRFELPVANLTDEQVVYRIRPRIQVTAGAWTIANTSTENWFSWGLIAGAGPRGARGLQGLRGPTGNTETPGQRAQLPDQRDQRDNGTNRGNGTNGATGQRAPLQDQQGHKVQKVRLTVPFRPHHFWLPQGQPRQTSTRTR